MRRYARVALFSILIIASTAVTSHAQQPSDIEDRLSRSAQPNSGNSCPSFLTTARASRIAERAADQFERQQGQWNSSSALTALRDQISRGLQAELTSVADAASIRTLDPTIIAVCFPRLRTVMAGLAQGSDYERFSATRRERREREALEQQQRDAISASKRQREQEEQAQLRRAAADEAERRLADQRAERELKERERQAKAELEEQRQAERRKQREEEEKARRAEAAEREQQAVEANRQRTEAWRQRREEAAQREARDAAEENARRQRLIAEREQRMVEGEAQRQADAEANRKLVEQAQERQAQTARPPQQTSEPIEAFSDDRPCPAWLTQPVPASAINNVASKLAQAEQNQAPRLALGIVEIDEPPFEQLKADLAKAADQTNWQVNGLDPQRTAEAKQYSAAFRAMPRKALAGCLPQLDAALIRQEQRVAQAAKEQADKQAEAALPKNVLLSAYQNYIALKRCFDSRKGYALVYMTAAELADAKTQISAIEAALLRNDTTIDKAKIWDAANAPDPEPVDNDLARVLHLYANAGKLTVEAGEYSEVGRTYCVQASLWLKSTYGELLPSSKKLNKDF